MSEYREMVTVVGIAGLVLVASFAAGVVVALLFGGGR